MTRIAMFALSYYPDDPRIRREAETLARAGMAVDIFSLRGDRENRIENFGRITVYRILEGTRKDSFLRYVSLSVKFIIAAFFKLNKLFFAKHYHLIQFHNLPDYLVFIGVIQKFLGIPIVLDLHDLMVELFESKWRFRKIKRLVPLIRWMEKTSCQFADHLITTSKGFQERLIDRGFRPEKITLVMNSADEHIFQNHVNRKFTKIEKGAKLLYHGTVAKRFGLATAIDAVARLQDMVPETTLCIYGRYEPAYRSELETRVKRLGLSGRVVWGEYLSLEEICQIIRDSDIGIVPYRSDAFMNLALSTKTFEYVAMQLPVVASRLQSLKFVFDEDCIKYFEPGRADDLAKKVAELCLNPQLRENYVQSAASAYKNVSWSIMRDRYLCLLKTQMANVK